MLLHTVIKSTSINDAWFKSMKACMQLGVDYLIDQGEYEGQYRRELELVTVHIDQPWIRPLACQSVNITPTTDEKIEKYFNEYIMDPDFIGEKDQALREFQNNEYKYSTWIGPSWQYNCDLLLKGEGGCNQATISIGPWITPNENERGAYYQAITKRNHFTDEVESSTVYFIGGVKQFKKPPCLRLIDMRLRDKRLYFIVYFRSWDLVGGFPENLGGIQRLKETCIAYMNSIRREDYYKDGSIVAVSKGLHLYDHYWDKVEEYVGREAIGVVETDGSGIWTV